MLELNPIFSWRCRASENIYFSGQLLIYSHNKSSMMIGKHNAFFFSKHTVWCLHWPFDNREVPYILESVIFNHDQALLGYFICICLLILISRLDQTSQAQLLNNDELWEETKKANFNWGNTCVKNTRLILIIFWFFFSDQKRACNYLERGKKIHDATAPSSRSSWALPMFVRAY